MKKYFFVGSFIVMQSVLLAQQNWRKIADTSSNFYTIKAAFLAENIELLKSYYENIGKFDNEVLPAEHQKEEYRDIIHFLRAAEWIEPRVSETNGNMDAVIEADFKERLNRLRSPVSIDAANWTLIGPINTDAMPGNGRVNSIVVDPNNASVLYACTPASQLWKSTNGGTSWAVISNGIPATGVTDIAIDPTNSNIIYALTGDADRAIYHPSSRGVYKTTDGGANWAITGLSISYSSGIVLTSIIINPSNPSIVLVSGSNGIYRSINAGVSYTQVNATFSIRELLFNPLNPQIVYAGSKTGAAFIRSNDGGVTWVQNTTGGLPTNTTALRFSIDVSPVDTNVVYLMATNTAHNLEGFYKSVNGGASFTKMSITPNIPNGQGWYNLAVKASNTDANTVFAAGLTVYKSINGGTTFSSISIPHVDVHDLKFIGENLYAASDGGVYRYTGTGTTWTNLSSNMSIAQPYSLGLSTTNNNLMITGHQDNGSNITTNGITWSQRSGGDGMVAFIHRTNNNKLYCTYQNGVLRRSTNGGTSFSTIKTVDSGYWVTPYIQDPIDTNTIYTGGKFVEKSIDGGTTWSAISNTITQVRWMDVSRTNNQIIYYTTASAIFKTIDGGINWTNVSGTVPTTTKLHIHIDVNNPDNVYVSLASTSTNQVYFTNNGGTSWTNISSGLPSVPANTIVTVLGQPGIAYCGTDIGVYFRNTALSSSWVSFNTGLPVVPVRDLEINYTSGKIRAATFGRSVWESDLEISLPIALVSFYGNIENKSIKLNWQTSEEKQASHFEIEKSNDSRNWQILTTKNANGLASNYEVLDEKPFFGNNYYRLKMIDKDGKYKYSEIKQFFWKDAKVLYTIYPNPVKNKLFIKEINGLENNEKIQIVNISGKLILNTTAKALKAGIDINNLPNGNYFIKITNNKNNELIPFIVAR